MSEVLRYLIQKTPIGTMMKPNPDGNWISGEDFDRVTAERDALQLRLNAVDDENDRLRNGLKRLAHHDCGCVPCRGQCRTGRAAEIEFEERMQYAAELLEKNS